METTTSCATGGSQTFEVVNTSCLETLQVAQMVESAAGGQMIQYITDEGQTIGEWFVVESAQHQVLAPVVGAGAGVADGVIRCLVCHVQVASGWSVHNCYTKHGKQVLSTVLTDVLQPAGYEASATGCEQVCDSCASLLNDVDEFSHRLRDTQEVLRNKFKRSATPAEKSAEEAPSADQRHNSVGPQLSCKAETSPALGRHAQVTISDADDPPESADGGGELDSPACHRHAPGSPSLLVGCDGTVVDSGTTAGGAGGATTAGAADGASGGGVGDAKAVACDCGEAFATTDDLWRHRMEKHWDFARLECDQCQLRLETARAFCQHMKTEHGQTKPFSCSLCDKRFSLIGSLRIHARIHTGVKPYQCNLCGKAFSQQTSLQSHMRTHTNQRPYSCDVCQRSFREVYALRKHKLIHSGEKPYQCELCEQRFRQKCVLNRHLRTHTGERPYQCDQCEERFIDSCALKTHKVQHTGRKPYYCEHCGKGFSDSYWFSKHQLYHRGERPFKCDVCPKAFTDARILRTHKKQHSGDKPHICYVCGARFSNSSHLTRHGLIHSGAKPFECSWCKQKFRDKSTLKRHTQTHTCRKGVACDSCGRTFARREALAAHRRTCGSAEPDTAAEPLTADSADAAQPELTDSVLQLTELQHQLQPQLIPQFQ